MAQTLLQGLGQGYAAAHYHHVDVLGRAFEKEVAHVASHHVALQPEAVGSLGNQVEDVVGKQLGELVVGPKFHCVLCFNY